MKRCFVAAGFCAIATVCLGQTSFSNASAISIPASGLAAPYPSTIGVPGPGVTISNVVVTLRGLTHPRDADLDIVLVGPGGQTCMLMSDSGASAAVGNLDLTFSRTGRVLRAGQAIASGTFSPVNIGATLENFPAPGPGFVSNVDLGVFDGTSSTGTWSLFVVDDSSGPASTTGTISSGWTIRFNDPVVEVVQSSTQFSYQGVLKRDGAPYSGNADLRFSLWNGATDTSPGAQFGSALTQPAVAVSQGVFSVLLDFGAGAFGEQQRFLQVEARTPADGANFVAVLPRSVLTGVPFAGIAPLAKAANQLDAPDGLPAAVVAVDNFGFATVTGPLEVTGTLDVGFTVTVGSTLTANGGIVIPATTRSKNYPSYAWRPSGSATEYSSSGGDWLIGTTSGASVAMFLPLDLPEGAVLTEFTVFYEDNSTQTLSLTLRRTLNTGNSATNISTLSSPGALAGGRSITASGLTEPVNPDTYGHTILATWTVPTPSNAIRLGNVRVKYTVTTPLP